MKFGRVMVDEAEGTILAHSIKLRGVNFKKGRLLTNSDVALLKQADCEDLVVARLGPNDLSEDEAARREANAKLAATRRGNGSDSPPNPEESVTSICSC